MHIKYRLIEEWEYAYTHNKEGLIPFCEEKGITIEELSVKIAEAKKRLLGFLKSLISELRED